MRDDASDLVSLDSQLKADIEKNNFDSSLEISRLIENKLKTVNFTDLVNDEIQVYNEVYAFYDELVKLLNQKKLKVQSQFSETKTAKKAIKTYKSI